jgi:hypothetical protein
MRELVVSAVVPPTLDRALLALVIFGSSPAKDHLARRKIGTDVEVDRSGGASDPATAFRANAISDHEETRRVASARIVGVQRLDDILLRHVEPPRDAGILFYVASGGKDLSEALALFARYFRIVNEAVPQIE